ncbi:MAG: hypothetical protein FJ098_11885 [Deltaproteobacteria bacterium]|nr:hypothetical protein [Deltaproteobacteria bacterium]
MRRTVWWPITRWMIPALLAIAATACATLDEAWGGGDVGKEGPGNCGFWFALALFVGLMAAGLPSTLEALIRTERRKTRIWTSVFLLAFALVPTLWVLVLDGYYGALVGILAVLLLVANIAANTMISDETSDPTASLVVCIILAMLTALIGAGLFTYRLVGAGVEGIKAAVNDREGSECASDTDCGDLLVCNGGYDPPECHPRGGAGFRCMERADCEPDLVCHLDMEVPRCVRPEDLERPAGRR